MMAAVWAVWGDDHPGDSVCQCGRVNRALLRAATSARDIAPGLPDEPSSVAGTGISEQTYRPGTHHRSVRDAPKVYATAPTGLGLSVLLRELLRRVDLERLGRRLRCSNSLRRFVDVGLHPAVLVCGQQGARSPHVLRCLRDRPASEQHVASRSLRMICSGVCLPHFIRDSSLAHSPGREKLSHEPY